MQDNNPIFTFNYNYTYSLKETAEIQKIRDKYRLTREENDFEQLKKLDRATCRRSKIVSLIICALAAALSIIGTIFTVARWGGSYFSIFGKPVPRALILGIIFIISGLLLACSAYPIYKKILRHDKRLAAPRILEMSSKLLDKQ